MGLILTLPGLSPPLTAPGGWQSATDLASCTWRGAPRPTLVAQQAHTTDFHTKNSFRRSGLSVDLCACLALYLYFFLTDLPKIILTSLNASP